MNLIVLGYQMCALIFDDRATFMCSFRSQTSLKEFSITFTFFNLILIAGAVNRFLTCSFSDRHGENLC